VKSFTSAPIGCLKLPAGVFFGASENDAPKIAESGDRNVEIFLIEQYPKRWCGALTFGLLSVSFDFMIL
jgi:hypothetical protein